MTDDSADDSLIAPRTTPPATPAAPELPPSPPSGPVVGPYHLRQALGKGGMGIVYRAWHSGEGREVALKMMLPEIAAEANHKRFLREARSLAKLDHPHVVKFLEVGEHEGQPYFTMPLLRGETLHSRWMRDRGMPVADVVRFGYQGALGLAHVHANQLVHRDVKPGNFWLEDGDERVLLLDFGLVRAVDGGTITSLNQVVGTQGFMAPEQAAAGLIDHRCDQFSLGATLYFLCTGLLAFCHFPPPRERNREVPEALEKLIYRLLSYEPDDRFASMDEVATRLASLAATLTVRRPVPAPATRSAPPRSEPQPPFTNSIGMRFVPVPVGEFVMGSPADEPGRRADEAQRRVRVGAPFYLGVFAVTQGQYRRLTGKSPSYFGRTGKGKDRVAAVDDYDLDEFPVESVSWDEAAAFIDRLNALPAEGEAGVHYFLPSEAQWEYACRGGPAGGPATPGNHYGTPGGFLGRTCKAGCFAPNGLGLFDMLGNVMEWCADWYGAYESGARADPSGPGEGLNRVARGGSWEDDHTGCRAAARHHIDPSVRYHYVGFRVAATVRGGKKSDDGLKGATSPA